MVTYFFWLRKFNLNKESKKYMSNVKYSCHPRWYRMIITKKNLLLAFVTWKELHADCHYFTSVNPSIRILSSCTNTNYTFKKNYWSSYTVVNYSFLSFASVWVKTNNRSCYEIDCIGHIRTTKTLLHRCILPQ